MGNSCTRHSESQVVQSHRPRGRWSNAGQDGSVDLDELIEAPSPPPVRHSPSWEKEDAKKHKAKKNRSKSSRSKSRRARSIEEDQTADEKPEAIDVDAVISGEVNLEKLRKEKEKRKKKREKARRKAERSASKRHSVMDRFRSKRKEEHTPQAEAAAYNSYEDPGFLTSEPIELDQMDSDLILGSPMNSPSVIHARWGEPVDDPDEVSICNEYRPNPFKLGFCVNCQKQHDVDAQGEVDAKKNYKKITLPAVAKTAANAELNPAAVDNAPPPSSRESDVDLAALLQQRRDILLKLNKLEREKQKRKEAEARVATIKSGYADSRHTMCLSDSGGNATLAHLRRMSAMSSTTSGPQSCRVPRGSSMTLSPRPLRGISRSISIGGSRLLEDEEPAVSDWC